MSTESKTLTRDELQEEGRTAYFNDEDDDSPYPFGSDESDFWHEGFNQARDEDKASH